MKNAENNQAKIKILENLFIDLRDVISLTRESSRTEKQDQLLLAYLLSIRIERTSQRNLLLVQQTKKPQDCVRLLDINIQQTSELSQNDSIKDNEAAQVYFEAQIQAYKTLRSYFLAKTHAAAKRWREAAILFQACASSVKTLRGDKYIAELSELLSTVKDTAETEVANAKANFVLDSQDDQVVVVPQKVVKSKKPLMERLDEFREESQLLSKNPNLVTLPPNMEPVPAKPLFFDLANNLVTFPDLSEKLEGQTKTKQAAGISGFVKGLWGWGSKK